MTEPLATAIAEVPAIGVIRRCPPEHVAKIAAAAVHAGLRIVEVTMDSDGAEEQLREVRAAVPDHIPVGAGTVRELGDAHRALRAGAQFIVSPGYDEAVVRAAADAGVETLPGITTPTELTAAATALRTYGLPVRCKFFPSGPLGTSYLRALMEPFPDVDLVCTGGIDASNARDFLDAGAVAVGLSGAVFPRRVMRDGDVEAIERATRELLQAITT